MDSLLTHEYEKEYLIKAMKDENKVQEDKNQKLARLKQNRLMEIKQYLNKKNLS